MSEIPVKLGDTVVGTGTVNEKGEMSVALNAEKYLGVELMPWQKDFLDAMYNGTGRLAEVSIVSLGRGKNFVGSKIDFAANGNIRGLEPNLSIIDEELDATNTKKGN